MRTIKFRAKKRECWENFKFARRPLNTDKKIFDAIFDRAYALGKQEKDAEDPVIQGWAARDEDGALCIYEYKPKRVYDTWAHENVWIGDILLRNVHTKPFFNLTWEDEPEQIEIIIKRKKNAI